MNQSKYPRIGERRHGRGLGGLKWKDVNPVMEEKLGELSQRIRIEVWI